MIVDFHVHCFPDELAPRAMAELTDRGDIRAYTDGTRAGLLASMEAAGISQAVIQTIATHPRQVETINTWAGEIQEQNDRLLAFGTLHPEYEEYERELDRMVEIGIRGVKLHPDYQQFYVAEKRMFPIYEAIFDRDLPLLFHAGVDIGLPEPVHCLPEDLSQVVASFPGASIIAAHMGGYLCWRAAKKHLWGKPLYLDTSFSIDFLGKEKVTEIIELHGSDRVLFATDSPWAEQKKELEAVNGLGLTPKDRECILAGNARRLLNLDPHRGGVCSHSGC